MSASRSNAAAWAAGVITEAEHHHIAGVTCGPPQRADSAVLAAGERVDGDRAAGPGDHRVELEQRQVLGHQDVAGRRGERAERARGRPAPCRVRRQHAGAAQRAQRRLDPRRAWPGAARSRRRRAARSRCRRGRRPARARPRRGGRRRRARRPAPPSPRRARRRRRRRPPRPARTRRGPPPRRRAEHERAGLALVLQRGRGGLDRDRPAELGAARDRVVLVRDDAPARHGDARRPQQRLRLRLRRATRRRPAPAAGAAAAAIARRRSGSAEGAPERGRAGDRRPQARHRGDAAREERGAEASWSSSGRVEATSAAASASTAPSARPSRTASQLARRPASIPAGSS